MVYVMIKYKFDYSSTLLTYMSSCVVMVFDVGSDYSDYGCFAIHRKICGETQYRFYSSPEATGDMLYICLVLRV